MKDCVHARNSLKITSEITTVCRDKTSALINILLYIKVEKTLLLKENSNLTVNPLIKGQIGF
jgi:hypothetical protein